MGLQYTLVGSEDGSSNITVFVTGKAPQVAHSTHPNFDAIRKGVMAGDESVVDLFDVATTAASRFERLTERVTHANGRLYLDGVEVANQLADQVVRFLRESVDDWKPLVAFFENVQQNPNEHSREHLYRWIHNRDLTITDAGLIVGYKGVNRDLTSVTSGKAIVDGETKTGHIPNEKGSLIEMPRDEVTFDPGVGCSYGLHVGTHGYAAHFGEVVLEVHVNPRDVVSVPTDSSNEKMRVCRYRVIDEIHKPHFTAVVPDWYDEDDEDEDDPYEDDNLYDGDLDDDTFVDDDQLDLERFDDESPMIAPEDDLEPVDEIDNNAGESTDFGVKVGDEFVNRDSRRQGTTFKVESIEDGYAIGKSLPQNVTRKIRLDRLTSYRYNRV